MSEPAMSAQAAVAEIGRLERLRGPLERRTSGISWMIWGLATTGIFVTYNYFGVIGQFIDRGALYMMPFLWMPWVAMGLLATRAIYNSAGIFVPNVGNAREGWVISGVFIVVMFGGFWLAASMDFPIVEPAIFLGLMGLVSLVIGSVGFGCVDRTERKLHILAGLVFVLFTLLPLPFLPTRDMAYAVYGTLAPLVTAFTYFGIGLFMVKRG